MTTNIFLVLVSLGLCGFSGYNLQLGLRALIAHQNLRNAIQSVRAQRWDLLVAFVRERSLKLRFFNQRYIILIGLEAREKLQSPDVATWRQMVADDQILRLHYPQIAGRDSKEIEAYLVTQYLNDVTLIPVAKAQWLWGSGTLIFIGGLFLLIFALAALNK
jgi:hypothetical protein